MVQRVIYLCIFLLAFSCKNVFATHAAGMDITYECISSGSTFDTHEVTVRFYRDCGSNSPAPSSLSLSYSSSCGSGATNLSLTNWNPNFITPLCAGASSPCTNNQIVELEEYIYRGNINLASCNDWVLSVCVSGNRNNAINTIINPGAQGLCVQAEINNINTCNNSPSFIEYPAPYICVGQSYCYNNGAIDAEGDSLVYSLETPLNNSSGGGVTYLAGFSPSNPITGSTTFDQLTGDLCMTGTQTQVSVLSMKITEYRGGVKIGSVLRDIQIIVLNCLTTPPVLSGFDGVPQDVTNAGPEDDSLHFCVNGADNIMFDIECNLGSSNAKIMSWSGINNVPTASFSITNNNSNAPYGTFQWTPQYSDVINSPFTFTVNVVDDGCPINNVFSYTYIISLHADSNYVLTYNTTSPTCIGDNDASIDISISGLVSTPTITWNGPGSFSASTQNISSLFAGIYSVAVEDYGCVINESITISDPPSLNNIIDVDSVSCTNGNDGAIDITILVNTTGFLYNWTGPNGFTSTSQDISTLYSGLYSLTITDTDGCNFIENVLLPNPNPFNISVDVDSITCFGGNDGEIDLTLSTTNNISYNWVGPNGFTSTFQDIDLLFSGDYEVTISDINGCTFIDTIYLFDPPPIESLDFETACDSYFWNNTNYTTSGIYSYPTTSAAGCDSTAILDLTIINSNQTNIFEDECDSYIWDGVTYNTTGVYTNTYISSITGCDSIVNLNLTIRNSTISTTTIQDCNPYLWNGIIYYSSGFYIDTITNSVGCDSIVELDLNVTEYEMQIESPICENEYVDININMKDPLHNLYTVIINDLDSSYSFYVDSLGNQINPSAQIQFVLQESTSFILETVTIDENNCVTNTLDTVSVFVNPLPNIELNILDVCVNTPAFVLNQGVPEGGFYFINNVASNILNPINIGVGEHTITYKYTDSLTSCMNTIDVPILVFAKPTSNFYSDRNIVQQDTVIQFYNTTIDYVGLIWDLDNGVTFTDVTELSYSYADTGRYNVRLIVENEFACFDTSTTQITIIPSYTTYIPDVFTPNGDNFNNTFFPKGVGFVSYYIEIYNIWGGNIYSSDQPWSGSEAPEGKYAYLIITYDAKNKIVEEYRGVVSLIK